MHADVGYRGGKKFSNLSLGHPNIAIQCIQGDRSFSVGGAVNDYILIVASFHRIVHFIPNYEIVGNDEGSMIGQLSGANPHS